jgi:hypothetical protein
LTPLVESSGASFLENSPRGEGAFLVEVVVNGAVEGCEFLETPHPPEAEHGPFSSLEWLKGILSPVVQPPSGFSLINRSQNLERSTVLRQTICDDRFNQAISSKRFS